MAVTLIVNNVPFEYPTQGEQAPWGEAASGWAQEVTTVLSSLNGPSDILETSATIQNNQSIAQPVPGLFFDPLTVRSFSVKGNVYRTDGVTTKYEEFTLTGLNTGSLFLIQQDGFGDSGVNFSITSGGQVLYTSSNFVSGIMKFRGIGILQT
jgi:hypothetical protein